ncbi:MAG: polysaccharide deacetylase family protein [Candidatus Fimenecus sp.]
MQTIKQNKIFKCILLCCAVIILILSVVLAVTAVKNKNLRAGGESAAEAYASLSQENASISEARAKEAESYQNQINEQSASFSSEKDALNQTIADLNKQISIKHASEAAEKEKATAPSPVPAEPQGGTDLSAKTIYLTFDDGPSARTPEILQILADYGVKATFFVKNGGKYNHYMKDIVEQGHTIALHTYSHSYSGIYASDEAYLSDLQQISDLVYNETGVRSNIMRFPGGSSNTVSKKYNQGIMTRMTQKVTEMGYLYYDWNLNSGDADKTNAPVSTIINNCRKVPKSNTVIVLMHDAGNKQTTVEALPEVIAYYQAAGCQFAAIDVNTPPIHQKVAN